MGERYIPEELRQKIELPEELIQRPPEDKIEIIEEEPTVSLADEQIDLSKDEEIDINTEEAINTTKDEAVKFSPAEKRIVKKLPKRGLSNSLKRGIVKGMTALTLTAGAMIPDTSRADDTKELSFVEKMSEKARNVRVGDNTKPTTPKIITEFAENVRKFRIGAVEITPSPEEEEAEIKRLEEIEKAEERERIRELEERENYEPPAPHEKKSDTQHKKETKKTKKHEKKTETHEAEKKTGEEYPMGELEGRSFGGLFKDYLGIEGKTKETEKIDFAAQLKKLWEKKIKRSGNKSIVKTTAEMLKKEYKEKDKRKMTIEQYDAEIQDSIAELNLNWDKVEQIKKLTKEQRQVLEEISKSIGSTELMAYMFTELFPSSNGELNNNIMAFLLGKAGARYVGSIPAIYDNWTSFGPYQFTSLALRHTEQGVEGASIINQAVDGKKIPGSVSKLKDTDHHRAAYLFTVNNLANLIKKLDKKELEILKENWEKNKDGVIQYIAAAHHAPSHAIKGAQPWIGDGMEKPYWQYIQGPLQKYALKTVANLISLKKSTESDLKPPKTVVSK